MFLIFFFKITEVTIFFNDPHKVQCACLLTLVYFGGFCASSFGAGPPWKATHFCLHFFHVSLYL